MKEPDPGHGPEFAEESEPPPGSRELARAILGDEPRYSVADVAAETGLPPDQVRRLWRSLGLPEHGSEKLYTAADLEAIRSMTATVDRGLLDTDLAVVLARALGQTMARLADWQVGALVNRMEEVAGAEAHDTRAGSALQVVEELSEGFEQLMVYAWRRHLAAAVARIEALDAADADLGSTRLSVGFADIVGFTALSNELSRDRIGDLVELFESRCADVVSTQRGRVIKSLGDSVLFVNDDPVQAYETAEGIISVIGRDPRMPDVRLGLATGAVVTRLGDVFGPPVNMAARLTAVARRNHIIIDAATSAALPEDRFETRLLPARPVRGFGLVEPVAVRRY